MANRLQCISVADIHVESFQFVITKSKREAEMRKRKHKNQLDAGFIWDVESSLVAYKKDSINAYSNSPSTHHFA